MGAFDSKANFVCVDIGAYGKNSDGGVFSHSQFGKVSIVLVTLSNEISSGLYIQSFKTYFHYLFEFKK